MVQTAPRLGEWLKPTGSLRFSSRAPSSGIPLVTVDDRVRYQRVAGFGAAMTDSSAWLIERELAPAQRTQLMDELFGAGGLRLDFLRVPIGASDFTVAGRPYSYDDLPSGRTDFALRHFSISHDRAWILPALREALERNPQIELLGTPWSPPAWMKGNASMSNVGDRGTLRPSAWRVWAAYIVRWLRAYSQAGATVRALTLQNEPGNPTRYPGMNFAAWAEAKWTGQDLLPALARAGLRPQIFGEDSGWASTAYAHQTVANAAAASLTGLSWHCYYGSPNVMSALHAQRPALSAIVDECSPGISAIPTSEVVISSLRNWASTVALWNLALDPRGGPVQAPNTGCPGCYGLATIEESGGSVNRNAPFFQLGQASEFIEPGAVRVASNSSVSYDYTRPGMNFVSAGLDDVALVNPDGSRVLLAYDNAGSPITFAVGWQGRYFRYTIPAGATATFRWSAPGSVPGSASASGGTAP